MRGNTAFFAKFRRKLRTKNFEAHFNRKLRTLEKCSNVKKLRTAEPQPIFTGSYKKKVYTRIFPFVFWVYSLVKKVQFLEVRWPRIKKFIK